MLDFLSCFSRNRFSQLFHQQTLRRQEEERKQEKLNKKQQKELEQKEGELEQKEEYEGKRRKVSDTYEKERDDIDMSEKRRCFRFSSSQKTLEEMEEIPTRGGCNRCLHLIYLSGALSFKKKKKNMYKLTTPYNLGIIVNFRQVLFVIRQ